MLKGLPDLNAVVAAPYGASSRHLGQEDDQDDDQQDHEDGADTDVHELVRNLVFEGKEDHAKRRERTTNPTNPGVSGRNERGGEEAHEADNGEDEGNGLGCGHAVSVVISIEVVVPIGTGCGVLPVTYPRLNTRSLVMPQVRQRSSGCDHS